MIARWIYRWREVIPLRWHAGALSLPLAGRGYSPQMSAGPGTRLSIRGPFNWRPVHASNVVKCRRP